MPGDTTISWTDRSWNPTVGCTKPRLPDGSISEGCRHCYAAELHGQRHRAYQQGKLQQVPQYARPFHQVQLLPGRLGVPLRWTRPARIFVNSVSDLLHEAVPDAFLDQVFGVMLAAADHRGHTFQVLTKRPERLQAYLLTPDRRARVAAALSTLPWAGAGSAARVLDGGDGPLIHPRLWLGTSVEHQAAADARLDSLIATPAAVRFLSCEPLLGPVDLSPWLGGAVHWVIAGGESGAAARPMHPDWARQLRDACEAAGVAFHFKQWGRYGETGTRAPGGRGWTHRTLDGQVHDAFPQVGSP